MLMVFLMQHSGIMSYGDLIILCSLRTLLHNRTRTVREAPSLLLVVRYWGQLVSAESDYLDCGFARPRYRRETRSRRSVGISSVSVCKTAILGGARG